MNDNQMMALQAGQADDQVGSGQPGLPEPKLGRSVSLDHAAEMLGVSRRTIYNRIREGRLVTIRTLGGSQRVLLDSVNLSKES